MSDSTYTSWNGSVIARGGQIARLEGWRFEATDAINGSSWKLSTRNIHQFGGEGLFGTRNPVPMVSNGIIVILSDANENTRLEVKTAQGDFSLSLAEIPFGRSQYFLNRRA